MPLQLQLLQSPSRRSLALDPSSFTLDQGLVLRRWHNPRLEESVLLATGTSHALGEVLPASLLECVPCVIVVIACSHTSLNLSLIHI